MAKSGRWELGLTKVSEGLWVGPASYVTPESLATRNITTLVWATPDDALPALPESVRVLEVPVSDHCTQDLSPFFPLVVSEYRRCRSEGSGMASVCRAGISRSSSLALAALIGQEDLAQMSLRQAYDTLKSARPMIRPNAGFFSQLVTFEKAVRPGTESVRMGPSPYEAGEMVPDVYLEEVGLKFGKGDSHVTFIPFGKKKKP